MFVSAHEAPRVSDLIDRDRIDLDRNPARMSAR